LGPNARGAEYNFKVTDKVSVQFRLVEEIG
jgi:hypothetical protein